MRALAVCAVLLATGWLREGAAQGAADDSDPVSVVRLRVMLEQLYTLDLNNTIEYILEFIPRGDQGEFPTRLWVSTSGGDTARPVLLTARQPTGAQTWQLPRASSASGAQHELLYELERTLCTTGMDEGHAHTDHCDDVEAGSGAVRGQFSLHVASACAGGVAVQVRATPVREWRLPFDQPHVLRAAQAAAGVRYYTFGEGQHDVRLVASSEDNVCVTLSVQDYTCPIPETLPEIGQTGLRLTMQRSGAAQLSRSQFPRGFIVVVAVHATDAACDGEREPDGAVDWLWDEAAAAGAPEHRAPLPRFKELTLTVRSALTRGQYVAGTLAATGLFVLFYVAFGGAVLAQRWPPCARVTRPRAVLAPKPPTPDASPAFGMETAADTELGDARSPAHRRRRGSDATYDSSDNSDSEPESEPGGVATPTTTTTLGTAPGSPTSAASPPADIVTMSDVPAPANGAAGAAGAGAGRAVPAGNEVHVSGEGDATATPAAPAGVAGAAGDSGPTPFGLPARLNVAALARRHERTIRARSDRYAQTLYIVAVFYALPVVQFVAAFQLVLNVSGSLDLCYYNFLCAHPAGAISDFNHVFSNLGYLLLGALFIVQVHRRRRRRRTAPRHPEYGIPAHYGLFTALGAGMMMVALLSASYHVCPNQLNFQFDTAFMYVLAVLSMVKIYQSRHPDVNARAHATFGVLAVLIALVVWGVLGGGALFWGVFTVLHVFTFLLLSLRIYYVGQFRFDKQSLSETRRGLRHLRPLYSARLVLLVIANAVNWLFALYGLFTMAADFAGHLLSVLLCNTLLYMVFYLAMKLLHGERLRWYAWGYLAGGAGAWAPALYFFVYGSSSWSATPAHSRHENHECKVLQFYDAHDLWHMLSAAALYLSFNAMLTWDDGLSAVHRTDIAVF